MRPADTNPVRYTIRRWTNHGKDRLYLTLDNAPAGYVDLLTGTPHPEPGHDPTDMYTAAATWAVAHMLPIPAMPATIPAAPVRPAQPDDLASVKAGSGVSRHGSKWRRFLPGVKQTTWDVGAQGERAVGKRLDHAHDLRVLHSVVRNDYGADIDHIVFSTHGIYTINTKTHLGATVTVNAKGHAYVNGTAVAHLTKARTEAAIVTRVLSRLAGAPIPVTPIIAVVGAKEVRANGTTTVIITTEDELVTTIRARQSSLTQPQIDWLYNAARDPAVWR